MRQCEVCGINIEDKKATAKTCSAKCRKLAFSKRSIGTENSQNGTASVMVAERQIEPELYFEFYTISKANGLGRKKDEKSAIRKAKYWYDVPLAAVPIIKKGFPEFPDFMNGRQYFLWWKNEFKMNSKEVTNKETGEITVEEIPEIHNPFPVSDKPLVYVQAGENSRHWGTN